jgi:hypothetical protein
MTYEEASLLTLLRAVLKARPDQRSLTIRREDIETLLKLAGGSS